MSEEVRGNFLRQFSQIRPRLIPLLQAASKGRDDLTLAAFDEAQIRWAIETGLGPLLFQTTKTDPEAAMSPLWPLLQSANLTAHMLTGEQLNAMGEIIDACEGQGHVLTLLKGISICVQHYSEPHLRLMRDVDFLVQDNAFPFVESILLKLGYRQQAKKPPEFYEKHHHSMPFFHPQRGLWVEVHRGLFSPEGKIDTDEVFSPEIIKTQIRLLEFRGRRATRLSDELQIIYIASHWARGNFKVVGSMIAMMDIICLLKNTKDTLCWEQILDWLHGSAASTHLYLMLTYLDKYQLVDVAPEILHGLFLRQRSFGNMNLKIMHTLIDHYFVDGRTFGRVLNLRNLRILWRTLLLPGQPFRNLMLVPWNLLPSRLWIRSHFYRLKPTRDLRP